MDFKTSIAGSPIHERFLWPKDEQDVRSIKLFAISILTDHFGRRFGALDAREIECKYQNDSLLLKS